MQLFNKYNLLIVRKEIMLLMEILIKQLVKEFIIVIKLWIYVLIIYWKNYEINSSIYKYK